MPLSFVVIPSLTIVTCGFTCLSCSTRIWSIFLSASKCHLPVIKTSNKYNNATKTTLGFVSIDKRAHAFTSKWNFHYPCKLPYTTQHMPKPCIQTKHANAILCLRFRFIGHNFHVYVWVVSTNKLVCTSKSLRPSFSMGDIFGSYERLIVYILWIGSPTFPTHLGSLVSLINMTSIWFIVF